MSDATIRIAPADPTHVPSDERAEALVATASALLPGAERVVVEHTDEITFLDAGANQGPARCPRCGAGQDDGWWGDAMAASFSASRFADRRLTMPCCGATSALDELDHGDWPVAFARWWVDCRNPGVGRLTPEQVGRLSAALGHPVTVVYRHL